MEAVQWRRRRRRCCGKNIFKEEVECGALTSKALSVHTLVALNGWLTREAEYLPVKATTTSSVKFVVGAAEFPPIINTTVLKRKC